MSETKPSYVTAEECAAFFDTPPVACPRIAFAMAIAELRAKGIPGDDPESQIMQALYGDKA